MLYRAKAIRSEGHKDQRGNRVKIADLNWLKGYSTPCDIIARSFEGVRVHHSLFVRGELSSALVRGRVHLLVHPWLYTFIYMCVYTYIVMTINLFSTLVNSSV